MIGLFRDENEQEHFAIFRIRRIKTQAGRETYENKWRQLSGQRESKKKKKKKKERDNGLFCPLERQTEIITKKNKKKNSSLLTFI